MKLFGPVWLMQPIPYFGEELKGNWIYEEKIDGWRMQVIRYEDKVEFWGRRLEKNPNWTQKLSYLENLVLKILPKNTLLDCELYSDKGRSGIPSVMAKNKNVKPIIYVFDVIFFEGEFVGNKKLQERKNILKEIKFVEPFYLLEYKNFINIDKIETKTAAEGVVLKEINSLYQIGKEAPVATEFWRKIKYGSR